MLSPVWTPIGSKFSMLVMMAQSLSSGPVNWQLARQLAESELEAENTVGPADQAHVSEAVRRDAKFVDLTNYIWESLKKAMENHHH